MVIIIALIVSIILQLIALVVALSLIKRTKYNVTWVLVSLALLFMATRRIMELIPFLEHSPNEAEGSLSVWLGVLTSMVIAIGLFYIRKIFHFLKKVDDVRYQSEQKIISTIIKTEEKERQRFAKDMHDGLGPLLSSAKMSVSALKASGSNETNKEILESIETVVNEAIISIKEISNNLSPHILTNFGLHAAIKSFSDKLTVLRSVQIVINSNINNKRFNYNTEVILYRVICELISNTIRHARAKTINMDFYLENDILKIYYFDDGIGFDFKKVLRHDQSGMGYSNIISRLNSINGKLEIDSEKDKGVHINIFVKI
ncbi:MAG: hypothetical protein A2W91_09440 [Bacteroidetes bacterium GWF2_38_335]|nr:MAG: hypothetical protein A2W91_09440 [Bacteroidetes bacterium GWF2_38_335]OFY80809.1 MAG: hypothetical protein A2281_09060 [Bacteroidetes bacterium RIFOXYA12_FULL_38_20]HBS86209.1 histidine kinase [Bacteroidales bacterium]